MFWMMNGRNRRGMGGGLFLLPGLLFGGLFGIYAVLAVLNVAGIVIGAVVSGLAAAFSGLLSAAGAVFSGVGEGIRTCGTVVYAPMQALLAAKAGADYVAPYVNRIDNMGYDGVRVVQQIQDILDNNAMDCEVLAASFKNSRNVAVR